MCVCVLKLTYLLMPELTLPTCMTVCRSIYPWSSRYSTCILCADKNAWCLSALTCTSCCLLCHRLLGTASRCLVACDLHLRARIWSDPDGVGAPAETRKPSRNSRVARGSVTELNLYVCLCQTRACRLPYLATTSEKRCKGHFATEACL